MRSSSTTRIIFAGLLLALTVVAIGVWQSEKSSELVLSRTDTKDAAVAEKASERMGASRSDASLQEPPSTRAESSRSEVVEESSASAEAEPVTIAVLTVEDVLLAGAEVVVRAASQVLTGRTDLAGECVFELPVSVGYLTIETEAEGYFHGRFQRERKARIETRMYVSAELSGRIIDEETREPIQATVKFFHGYCDRTCTFDAVETDESGRFVFPSIAPDRDPAIGVKAPGYASLFVGVPPDRVSNFEVLLSRGREIRGRVFDVMTGDPIEGAMISDKHGYSLVSDEVGRFHGLLRTEDYEDSSAKLELPKPLPPLKLPGSTDAQEAEIHSYSISAKADGFLQIGLRVDADISASERGLVIPLLRAASFSGTVRTPAGVSLPDTYVSIRLDHNPALERSREAKQTLEASAIYPVLNLRLHDVYSVDAKTDADGAFHADGMTPWMQDLVATVSYEARQLEPIHRVESGDPGSVETLNLVVNSLVERSATIEGVYRFQGEPYAGTVYWKGPTDRGHTYADESGNFRMDVEPGLVEITPGLDPSGPGERDEFLGHLDVRDRLEVRLEPNETKRLDIDWVVPASRIEGSVHDEPPVSGALLQSQRVRFIVASKKFLLSDLTDEEGRFSIEFPSIIEEFDLQVWHGNQLICYPDLREESSPIAIVLPTEVHMQFRALDSGTGLPISNIQVHRKLIGKTYDWNGGMWMEGIPERGPGWRSAPIIPGVQSFFIVASGYRTKLVDAVNCEEGARIETSLDPELLVRLKLEPPGQSVPYGTTVYLLESGFEHLATGEPGPDEEYIEGRSLGLSEIWFGEGADPVVGGLVPSLYSFHSIPPGIVFDPPGVDLRAGSLAVVLLRFQNEQ